MKTERSRQRAREVCRHSYDANDAGRRRSL